MKSLLLALTGAFLPIPSQAKTIACVGDSITYGSTSSDPSSTSYPPNLSRMLKGTMDVYNFGVSGATMKKDGDLPYWEQSAYDDALSSNPDYVVIQLGTNDAKTYQWDEDKYLEDYQAMIDSFASLGHKPAIYISIPSPLYEDDVYSMNQTVINTDLPSILTDLAKKNMDDGKVTGLVNVFEQLGGASLEHYEYFCDLQSCDSCHPSDAGYTVLATAVYKALFMKSSN
mmetsp:Transcript_23649/g.49260  ORF Transcript_23649/g.49260 Transcript_23649/m.49260 type:complete len:228 (+) Transcript_23649:263-946(+)